MHIGLHDSDKTGFPNLALMKISAWHKARGDTVEWWSPMFPFDRVYSSKVFTFTPECAYLPPDTIKGGTGYMAYMRSFRRRLTQWSRIIPYTRTAITQ